MAKRAYVTAARVRDLAAGLSQRDNAVLRDVLRVGVLSGQQLRRLHYGDDASSQRSARRDLSHLVELRVLARLDRRIGGVRAGSDGYVYALDVVGQRIAQPQLRRYREPWTPGPSHLAHALAVGDLYVQLRTDSSDWELATFEAEPACWRRFMGSGGRASILKPDAYVVGVADDYEDRFFIEVDRSTESLVRITAKADVYGRYWQSGREQSREGVFPRVLWITPDEHRRDQLVGALGRLDPAHWQLFAVTTAVEATATIVGTPDSSARTGTAT